MAVTIHAVVFWARGSFAFVYIVFVLFHSLCFQCCFFWEENNFNLQGWPLWSFISI
jgi:hypothetical protein